MTAVLRPPMARAAPPVASVVAPARHQALLDVAPIALSVAVFGLAIGATISASSLNHFAALSGSVLVIAGSSQLTAIELLDDGVALAMVVFTGLLVNLRLVMYGAGLARWFAHEPRRRRLLMVVPIVDQSFVMCQRRFENVDDPAWRRTYFWWVSAGLVVGFTLGQVIGLLVGSSLPADARLHLVAPLALSGLLVVSCRTTRQVIAAIISGAAVVAVAPIAGRSSLLVAVALAVAVSFPRKAARR